MTDGDRRIKSNIGLINQRYVFALIGNGQKLEVFSNYDRFRHSTPFLPSRRRSGTGSRPASTCWRTGPNDSGQGLGKGFPEPEAWTLEVSHAIPHRNGAPGYTPCPRKAKRRSISTTCPSSTTTKTSLHLMKSTKKLIPLGLPALFLLLAPSYQSQAADWPIWGRTGPATWYLPRAA